MPHVTFIHGIANKPSPDVLSRLWLRSLSEDKLGNDDSINLSTSGVTTSFIYWADVLYDKPLPEDSAFERNVGYESVENLSEKETKDPDMLWRENASGKEKVLIEALARKLEIDLPVDDNETPPPDAIDKKLERIPLP